MRGQDASRRLTDNQPRGSIQSPNGSCLNDAATLERENEDLKVFWILLPQLRFDKCSYIVLNQILDYSFLFARLGFFFMVEPCLISP